MTRSDRELMVAFQEGDDEAFEALYARHARPLLNFFYKMCYDRDLSEDLVQDTFHRIIRHRASYRPRAGFRAYLYTVARNLWIDRHRSRKAQPRTLSADRPVAGADADSGTLGDLLEGREPGIAKRASDREAAELVRKALEQLPEGQRMVFLMAESQGLPYREIAEILDIPVGTVKSRMNAAVTTLRGLLGSVLR